MRKHKKLAGALVLVVAVAALALVPVMAQATQGTPKPYNLGQLFQEKLAGALGISQEQLQKASTQAMQETIQEGVKNGSLTQQQADRLQQGLAKGLPWQFLGKFGKREGGRGPGVVGFGGNGIAQALGLTPQELRQELQQGQTLAQILEKKGMSAEELKAKIVEQAKQKLNQAVQQGKMTQAQADQALERLQKVNPSDLLNQKRPSPHKGGMRPRGVQVPDAQS